MVTFSPSSDCLNILSTMAMAALGLLLAASSKTQSQAFALNITFYQNFVTISFYFNFVLFILSHPKLHLACKGGGKPNSTLLARGEVNQTSPCSQGGRTAFTHI